MIAVAEDLDFPRGVVKIDKHAAVSHRPNPARDPDALAGFHTRGQSGVTAFELRRFAGARETIRIRVYPLSPQAFPLADSDRA